MRITSLINIIIIIKVLNDPVKQMDRLVEHYSELYSRENVVNTEVLNNKDCLCIMDELGSEPKLEELGKALDTLSLGKASGKDGIPEVLKCVKGILIKDLHEIFCQCCREGTVPQDMRDANIVTLYKNKGDRSDCNNYRTISFLSIVGKLFA